MKKVAITLGVSGILLILVSIMSDYIGTGNRNGIGAAQILGINTGVFLVLTAIGAANINLSRESTLKVWVPRLLSKISVLQPAVWIFITFVVVYIFFFITPLFFEKPSIQYFNKYIPDAWVTHIGFDMDMTMGRVGRWLTTQQSPYADNYYYAPLTLVLFAPFLILGYPLYYKLITAITLISYIVCAWFIPNLLSEKRNHALLSLFFITGLFSYGFQFELERGQYNLIAMALAFFAIYIFHRHEQYRYLAYALFSLSIQLKIYPVFLVVMFIKDWSDWKNNAKRIIGLGALNFFLLFVLGYQMFLDFINNLSGVQLYFQSSRLEDLSIKGFVYNLTTDGFGLISSDLLSQLSRYTSWLEGTILLIVGLCVFLIINRDYRQKRRSPNPYLLTVCTIAMLIVPSASVDYKLPLLITPLAIVFSELRRPSGRQKIVVVAITLILASTSYWITLYPFTVKPYLLSRNFLALFILMLSVTVLYVVNDDSEGNKIQINNNNNASS